MKDFPGYCTVCDRVTVTTLTGCCHRCGARKGAGATPPAARRRGPEQPAACTGCQTRIGLTPDWTLWPWPDGAWLCSSCNDARHETDDYSEIEARVRAEETKR